MLKKGHMYRHILTFIDCLGQFEGHKWNLKALWRYFEEELEMDWRPIWERIKVVR
jgi:hypothetical protein